MTYSNSIPIINNVDVDFSCGIELSNTDLVQPSFHGTNHFALLGLNLKPEKYLNSVSNISP